MLTREYCEWEITCREGKNNAPRGDDSSLGSLTKQLSAGDPNLFLSISINFNMLGTSSYDLGQSENSGNWSPLREYTTGFLKNITYISIQFINK